MTDDFERTLEQWGDSTTPSVDGAFANRLETRLRQQIVEEEQRRPAFGWLLRPGVLAVAGVILVVAIGLVANRSEPDRIGVADDNKSTTTTTLASPTLSSPTLSSPSTIEIPPLTGTPRLTDEQRAAVASSIAAMTSTTTNPDSPTTVAPSTTVAPTSTTTTAVSSTTSTATTSVPPVEPQPITEVNAQRNGRQLTISWRIDTTGSDVAGWVLFSDVGGESAVLETARGPGTRRFVTTIINVDADYRIEGRNAAGDVVFDSGEILFSPDE